jgi:hypothetical protein
LKELAPIVLFCYNRPFHLQKTIDSLLLNPQSENSDLFVYSDGPKTELELANVELVRKILSKVKGFKSINIKYSRENKGLAKSVIDGVSEVINKFKKVIVLEDDLEFSNDFLEFMNQSLDFYRNHPDIYSISGYSYRIDEFGFKNDLYLSKRISSWGWATWDYAWHNIDWNLSDFESFIKDKEKLQQFSYGGSDLIPMIRKQKLGVINSWAIRWTYHHFKNQKFCLIPSISKVKNIGTDGSGTNFNNTQSKYNVGISSHKIKLVSDLKHEIKLDLFYQKFYKPSVYRQLLNFFKYQVFSKIH